MPNPQQVLHSFWSSFDIPAHEENSVPDDFRNIYPRITYDVVIGDTMGEAAMSASIWDRATNWATVHSILADINERFSTGQVIMECDGGGLWIKKADPWAQPMGDPSDDSLKRIILNISVEYHTQY